ncbi:MAG: YraN family protein [Firmicutes bacterium]|nr:YraN family protein [Bacillota bacterium]
MTDKKRIGSIGEELAVEALRSKGYYIIRRNFSCPYGEVDIIAIKDKILSFVEVKTRTSSEYGAPGEAVDNKKQRHIRNAAKYFISYYKRPYEKVDFQVIEVTVNHIKGLEF